MSQLASGAIHKFLTGETVTGDDTQIATNINIAFELLRLAGNDTDTKVGNTYTKAQTDAAFGIRDSAIAQLSIGQIPPAPNAPPIPVSLGNGLQVYNNLQASPLDNVQIKGRTLVNLLGRDGNCEDVSKWNDYQSTHALDSTNKTIGSNGMKVTIASSTQAALNKSLTVLANKYYIMVADVKNGNATSVQVIYNPSSPSQVITDTTKFNTVYMKVNKSVDTTQNINMIVNGAAGQYGYFDALRVYEITLAEYNALDAMTAAQIAAKYPYVDDVKHVNAPYVIKYGENLLPTFNEWTLHANAVAVEPYKMILSATAGTQISSVDAPVIAGQVYTLTYTTTDTTNSYININWFDVNGVSLGFSPQNANGQTVTAPTNAVKARILATCLVAGTYTFTNPMLNLGATAKPFKLRNDDSLFFPSVQLASNVDGTVYDTLYKDKGKYFVEKRFKDMILDGSLAWTFDVDFSGFKRVVFTLPSATSPYAPKMEGSLVKYDGKILANTPAVESADGFYSPTGTTLKVYIADTDSGWGEGYTPASTAEIQAYFYGWRMRDAATLDPYTTGTKAWGTALSGGASNYTTTLPTSYAPAPYMPYKLTYQLATPAFEEIAVDAGMSLHEGLNQIEVGQGIVVREKVNASDVISGFNQINTGTYPLKNRNLKILKVYKNGKDDAWLIGTRAAGSGTIATLGNDYAQKSPGAYDPTATYEVSYIALDQYLLSAPVQSVKGETAANLKTVVDLLTVTDADQDARISANEYYARKAWNDNTRDSRSITMTNLMAAITLTNNLTWYKVPFNGVYRDNLSEFNTSLNRFVAKKTGTYEVKASLGVTNLASGQRAVFAPYKNGSIVQYIGDIHYTNSTYQFDKGTILVDLAAGDYVELYAQPVIGSGIIVDTAAQTTFMQIIQVA